MRGEERGGEERGGEERRGEGRGDGTSIWSGLEMRMHAF